MKWLITGGCGFIGRNLVRHLQDEDGHSIRILDNLSVGKRDDLRNVTASFREVSSAEVEPMEDHRDVELVVGDILDTEGTRRAAVGADVIVHLAANTGVTPSIKDPRKDCEKNVVGTLNVLEAARQEKVPRFIFASSGAPIGDCEPPIHEDIAPHPKSPYGASKLAGEGYCSAYYESYDLKTVVLRFGNVYGPLSGHKSSVVAKFIRRAQNGKVLEIYGDGNQTRDFIYTKDLVRAICEASVKDETAGEIFQIATNTELSINELATKLVQKMEASPTVENLRVDYTKPRAGDIRRNFSDTSKAEKQLGWQPRVDIDEGLDRTIRWFRNQD